MREAERVDRRRILKLASAGALGLAAPHAVAAPTRRRALRVAHLTDVHLQPQRAAAEGFAAALRHAQEQGTDLILAGGDNVMCVNDVDAAREREQSSLWRSVLRSELSRPLVACIGNHDILGMKRSPDGVDGKKYACDLLALPGRYHHFDRGGWRFVILDSTHVRDGGFVCRLDDEQFEWLCALLASTPADMPVMVVTHMPILSVTPFVYDSRVHEGNQIIPGDWTHIDCLQIKDMFNFHGRVRLCLSGHMHTMDRCDYLGVTYLCSGAVSGAWWQGPLEQFPEAYALIDLFDDGSFEHRFVPYGWVARE